MRQLTAATVHQAACGHWLEILQSLSGNLAEALQKPGRHVTCPVHGGKDGFRFFKDAPQKGGAVCNTCGIHSDGFSLLMWLNGWSFSRALHEVARYLKLENYSPRELKKVFAENRSNHGNQQGGGGSNPKRDAKLSDTIERIWGESLPYSCEAARPLQRYLSARRIVYLHDRIERSDSLRFHPSLSYFHGHRQHTCFPAILGAIRDRQGQLLTLQRIYLSKKGGKANVINPKKMLPFPSERTLAGAAIPLGAPELGVLGVAEGLETALAVASVTPYPVWSAVNATLLARFEPPEGVHTLLIWADRDHSLVGEKAANELKHRLVARGMRVYVFLPAPQDVDTSESLDWNEVLQQQGTQGFPTIENLLSFQAM